MNTPKSLFPQTVVVLLLLLFGHPSVSAQTLAEKVVIPNHVSEPPALSLGDSFTYHGYRTLSDAKNGKESIWGGPMDVREVRGNGEVLFIVNNNLENYRVFNRDRNLIEKKTPSGILQKYKPALEEHRYPMVVGEKFDTKSTYNPPDPDSNRQEFVCSGSNEAVGWESVTVPAGTFKALKIEASGWCSINPAGWSVRYKVVKWLALEMKMQPILYREDRYWSGGGSDFTYSLSSYSLAK